MEGKSLDEEKTENSSLLQYEKADLSLAIIHNVR